MCFTLETQVCRPVSSTRPCSTSRHVSALHWMPSATGKPVFAVGSGLFIKQSNSSHNGTANQLPFSLSTTVNNTQNLVCPYGGCTATNRVGADPYPFVYNAVAPRFVDNATTPDPLRAARAHPSVYEYNVAVEQQIEKNYALHLGYVGNSVHGNLIQIDTNAPLFFPNADISTNGLDCRRPYEPYRNGGPTNTTTCTYQGYLGSPALAGPAAGQTNALTTTYAGQRFGAVNRAQPWSKCQLQQFAGHTAWSRRRQARHLRNLCLVKDLDLRRTDGE